VSEHKIIRLRGDAPALVWPEPIEPLIEWCAELRRLTPDPAYVKAEGLARTAAHRLLRDWERTFVTAQDACENAFGSPQGWKSSERWKPRDLISGG
jgi:hypothetical protein